MAVVTVVTVAFFFFGGGARNGKSLDVFLLFGCSFCFERLVVSTPKW